MAIKLKLKDGDAEAMLDRATYEEFNDVVCFNTTYLTNQYELPFANFVGVNLHGQTILLGCALISHETTEIFERVFRMSLLPWTRSSYLRLLMRTRRYKVAFLLLVGRLCLAAGRATGSGGYLRQWPPGLLAFVASGRGSCCRELL
ncbi:Protein FAR1-RELATED SEQUENCE 5 [Bienertia sinuspersici]